MNDWPCDCSEDDGPCEDHATTLVSREGASHRTADELLLTFLRDVLGLIEMTAHTPQHDRDAQALRDDIDAALALPWSSIHEEGINHEGRGWLEPEIDPNAPDALQDMMMMAEYKLSDIGLSVDWGDGYRIYRLHDDCPLLAI